MQHLRAGGEELGVPQAGSVFEGAAGQPRAALTAPWCRFLRGIRSCSQCGLHVAPSGALKGQSTFKRTQWFEKDNVV